MPTSGSRASTSSHRPNALHAENPGHLSGAAALRRTASLFRRSAWVGAPARKLGGALAACTMVAAGCTPGAPALPALNGRVAAGMTVGVSLLAYGQSNSRFGTVGGYNPALVVVAAGTSIQFHNQDSFDHTATDIAGSTFPQGNPIPSSALAQSGSDVAQSGWSSGTLTAGAYSQVLHTSVPGTYLFGCFYHYPTMRGVIIVE